MAEIKYKFRSRKALEREARITATEAAKNFGRLVSRVSEERATYIVERGGKPVARIGPVEHKRSTMADFKAFVRNAPQVDEEYLRAVEDAVRRHNRPRVPDNPWER
jgi:antitoxin (DNA-binding transcriptional repressor) of toxin-antitoxin stability system